MKNTDYHSKTNYVSKSLLDQIHKSPAHYKAYIEGEKQEPTPAMIFGSLVHSVVFAQNNYAVLPANIDRRTKEGKAIYDMFMLANKGTELIVTEDQYQHAVQIRDAVFAHEKAALLLQNGTAETSIFGKLEDLDAKCRVDFLNTKHNVIVDLKTTNSAAPDEFAKSVWNYRYHVQAAFYLDLTKAERFFFIAVDKEKPFNVEIYELDSDAIEKGRSEYKQDIATLKKCLETNNWHGYTEDKKIHIISLPAWAK